MKRAVAFFSICAALFLSSLFTAASASAHVLKVDGSVGATLHVDPRDNPIAGEPASFFFEIKDRQNKFIPEQCICTVTIQSSSGATLHTEQLFTQSSKAGLSTPLLQYVFASGGVYSVEFAGSPKIGDQFRPFRLRYDVRVENNISGFGEEPLRGNMGDLWLYVGLGVFMIVVFMLALVQRKKKGLKVSVLALALGVVAAGSLLFYSGHYFDVIKPVAAHHHVEGETGHADAPYHSIAPYLPALAAQHFVVRTTTRFVLLPFFVRVAFFSGIPLREANRGPPRMIV